MNDTVRTENRKALPKFLLSLVFWAVIGGVTGYWMANMGEEGADQLKQTLTAGLIAALPWIIPVLMVAVSLPCGVVIHRCKKLVKTWNGDDEDLPDQVEQKLNWVILLTNTAYFIQFLALSCALILETGVPVALTVTAEFILAMVVLMVQQKSAVDLMKTMNPEKRGSVYDTNFQAKWMESCDEAERKRVGEAAYASFRTTNLTAIVLLAVLVALDFLLDIGILPSVIVTVLLAVSNGSYCIHEIRSCRKK